MPPSHGCCNVRAERPGDEAAVAAVVMAAFGRDDEARLVADLRAEGSIVAALVACEPSGGVIGHVVFSPLPIRGPTRSVRGAALAPLAVRPDQQRRGIGGALIRHGLAACRERGVAAVVVLGHPAYYPRFGFTPAAARGLADPFDAGDAFMVLELIPGTLGEPSTVRYARAFGVPG